MMRGAICEWTCLALALILEGCAGTPAPVPRPPGEAGASPIVRPLQAPREVRVADSRGGIAWVGDFDAAWRSAAERAEFVVLDVSQLGCSFCTRMEQEVYADPEFVEFSRRQVFMRLYRDENLGKATALWFGVEGFPTILVLTADGREAGRVVGFRAKSAMIREIQAILDRNTPTVSIELADEWVARFRSVSGVGR